MEKVLVPRGQASLSLRMAHMTRCLFSCRGSYLLEKGKGHCEVGVFTLLLS